MEDRSQLLGNYDVKKLLIKLSVPATIGMMVNALYNFVDTLFVALSEGEAAIGALTYAFPMQMILMAIGLMIGIGSASVFSRAFGRNDEVVMEQCVNTALRIDVLLAGTFSVLGFIFLKDILLFFEATPDNIGFATKYMQIILIGLVPLSLSMVLNNLARAEGRAKTAMIAMSLGAGLNIILDPIFIFGFGLGVQGAAIATVTSQIISFTYIFRESLSKRSKLVINVKHIFYINISNLKDILVIGFPTFIRNSVGAFLAMFIIKLLGEYVADPTLYVSIYGVINRVIFFIFMPGFGLVQGLTPIIGFNYGAKKFDRLYEVTIYATKMIVVYFFFGFIFVMLFGESVFNLFSKNNDAFFIEYGTYAFRIISYGFILVGFQIVLGAVYQALGYPVRALLVSLSRQLFLFVPIVFIMLRIKGLDGLWWTFAISDLTAGLISFLVMFYELKVIKKRGIKKSE